MDSSTHKFYHLHDFDSRQYLENYVSNKDDMVFAEDSLLFPIENLTKTFASGHIKGDILIDLTMGSLVHHLYTACEFFKYIIVLKVSDRCIMELKRWVDTRTGAFDWSHAVKLHADIEGKSHPEQDKEDKVRATMQHVVKCNLQKENLTDPIVLPLADCLISLWLLDVISKDKDDYIRYLKKCAKLLKPGGHLILIGDLDTTYITVGKHKVHYLTYNEEFARNALAGEGFVIDCCKVKQRTVVSDLCDYKAVIFIVAHKNK
ncbi:nicotinamide N-methyltransferase-like [Bufo bufo]|uniref:nicotinamide N-methyltransferase-like n=1 Tax=Bufo bufo TaxID=8384 RepID=UPI001ABE78BD|nr:nicotinamide N-methyltransferase-like [Bufo bufo]